jgi:ribonuclease BN (tRNA processing enzyme)
VPGHDPILFDLGTGLRYFGMTRPVDEPFRGSCLLSHLHWDHIQGLPFFTPLLRDGAELDVYAPGPGNGETVGQVMRRGRSVRRCSRSVSTCCRAPIRFHDGRRQRAVDR